MNKLNLLIAVCLAGWLNAVPVQAQVRTPTIYGYYDPFTGDWYRVYYNLDGSVKIEGGNVISGNQFVQTTNNQGTTLGRDRLGNHWFNDENTGYTVLSNGIVCSGKGFNRTCIIPPYVPIYGAPSH